MTRQSSERDSGRHSPRRHKWSGSVNTDATHPQAGLFNRDAETIARELVSKKVSPKGPSSGMRMLTFYINRAGSNLPTKRLKELEKAKKLLHERIVAFNDKERHRKNKRAA